MATGHRVGLAREHWGPHTARGSGGDPWRLVWSRFPRVAPAEGAQGLAELVTTSMTRKGPEPGRKGAWDSWDFGPCEIGSSKMGEVGAKSSVGLFVCPKPVKWWSPG